MKTLSNKKQTIFTKIRTPFGSQTIKSTIVDEWKFPGIEQYSSPVI